MTREGAVSQVRGFLDLPEGWDNEGASRVSELAISKVVMILSHPDTDIPLHMTPTSSGGIGLEWSIGYAGVQLEVTPEGEVGVFAYDSGCTKTVNVVVCGG